MFTLMIFATTKYVIILEPYVELDCCLIHNTE